MTGNLVGPRLAVPDRPATRLGTLAFMRALTTNTIAACDEELYDKLIVSRRYALQHVLFVSDPDAIRTVLIDEFDNYGRVPVVARIFAADLGTGSLASDGEVWARHRRISTRALDPRSITAHLPHLLTRGEQLVRVFEGAVGREPINFEHVLYEVAAGIWNQVLTGGDPRGLRILTWLSGVPGRFAAHDTIPWARWIVDRLPRRRSTSKSSQDGLLRELIAERRVPDGSAPRDLVARIIHAHDPITGRPLPDEEGRDEVASLMTGGLASVRGLTWFWYVLGQHPEIEAKVEAEIDAVIGDGPVEPDHLRRLTYTRQVLDEVMRLYPPIPLIPRQARRRGAIGGHPVRPGTVVLVIPWVVHRHRKLWAEPDRFDPDRFGPASPARPKLAYMPFAAGPRVCVGQSFALAQMMIVVTLVTRRYRFRLASREPVVPAGAVALYPRPAMLMNVTRRR